MRINHVAVFVSDMEESLKTYRDLLGFSVMTDEIVGPSEFFAQEVLDDLFKAEEAKSRQVLLISEAGTVLELQQPLTPRIQKAGKEQLYYGYTGLKELAFDVDDADQWFARVKDAGYEVTTDYVWEAGGACKSFLFHDPDGVLIQIVENTANEAQAAEWDSMGA